MVRCLSISEDLRFRSTAYCTSPLIGTLTLDKIYFQAIDIWFGFVTGFVFFTLLQTLFVIGFDRRANNLVSVTCLFSNALFYSRILKNRSTRNIRSEAL